MTHVKIGQSQAQELLSSLPKQRQATPKERPRRYCLTVPLTTRKYFSRHAHSDINQMHTIPQDRMGSEKATIIKRTNPRLWDFLVTALLDGPIAATPSRKFLRATLRQTDFSG